LKPIVKNSLLQLNKLWILCLLMIQPQALLAQDDWAWWKNQHRWPGDRSPLEYIVRTPGRMGPNALPIPGIPDPGIGYRTRCWIAGSWAGGKGDLTLNPEFGVFFPVLKNRLALEARTNGFEYFRMSPETRDFRMAKDSIGKGFSKSETHLSILARLWSESNARPSCSISFSVKPTTGKNLENARHINAPAYSFALFSGGKLDWLGVSGWSYRAQIGGMIWQKGDNAQNDAWIYGVGISRSWTRFNASIQWLGMHGYTGLGDRPQVLRCALAYAWQKWELETGGQYAFRDFVPWMMQAKLVWKWNWADKTNSY